jgi:hypothetical protein
MKRTTFDDNLCNSNTGQVLQILTKREALTAG